MLGVIKQFETEFRAERQMEDIHKAKQRSVSFGRQKRQGMFIKELMKKYGLSKATIYTLERLNLENSRK